MCLSLHLNFTLWNFIVGAHGSHFLGIMPIALTYKAAALFIASNQPQPEFSYTVTTVATID